MMDIDDCESCFQHQDLVQLPMRVDIGRSIHITDI